MKKVLLVALAVVAVGLIYAFMPKNDPASAASKRAGEGEIAWMTWDEAVKANEKAPKKILIDFYTDWCGWCKKMDASTFKDPAVVEYVNANFYPVKFNAEQKEDVVFKGTAFSFSAGGGRGGFHKLAYELLDGRLGYPSYVYLTPTYERILISPGYKDAPMLQKELKFVSEDKYSSMSWDQYRTSN